MGRRKRVTDGDFVDDSFVLFVVVMSSAILVDEIGIMTQEAITAKCFETITQKKKLKNKWEKY
jgi:hypothetical protein